MTVTWVGYILLSVLAGLCVHEATSKTLHGYQKQAALKPLVSVGQYRSCHDDDDNNDDNDDDDDYDDDDEDDDDDDDDDIERSNSRV